MVKHFRGYRRHWAPKAAAVTGLLLAAIAVSMWIYYFVGVRFT